MQEINLNTKLEIAVEIMAAKIALVSKEEGKKDDENLKKLLKERDEMYKGNDIIIEKIIEKYGPEIKNNYLKS